MPHQHVHKWDVNPQFWQNISGKIILNCWLHSLTSQFNNVFSWIHLQNYVILDKRKTMLALNSTLKSRGSTAKSNTIPEIPSTTAVSFSMVSRTKRLASAPWQFQRQTAAGQASLGAAMARLRGVHCLKLGAGNPWNWCGWWFGKLQVFHRLGIRIPKYPKWLFSYCFRGIHCLRWRRQRRK